MRRLTPFALLICVLMGCETRAASPATSAPAPSEAPRLQAPTSSTDLTTEERASLQAITRDIRENGSVSSGQDRERTNARLFLYLAATATDEAELVTALNALPNMWSRDPGLVDQGYSRADHSYAATLLVKLGDPRAKVQAAALAAAIPLLHTHMGTNITGEGRELVLNKVIELATDHASPEGKLAALEVLPCAVPPSGSPRPETLAPIVAALDAQEPWLVSQALFPGANVLSRVGNQAALQMKMVELTRHTDPGVRGRAAMALGSLPSQGEPSRSLITARLLEMLSDVHAYPKAAAIKSLSSRAHKPAIHEILKHVGDVSPTLYELRGWTQLSGEPGITRHGEFFFPKTVSFAALNAIQELTTQTPTAFNFELSAEPTPNDLTRIAGEARAWYRTNRRSIPTE